ncbi:MAG TPA: DUF1385 domain-containing protein [Gaiellaceae bacterium]|nr:DUF1385 domain-containing protein [Gaiellaceae bacterium]
MAEEKIRLGGMALANGVLVHGPTAWACAVRTEDGEIHVARGRKRLLRGNRPLLRGPARLLESLLVLPRVRRSLPQARFAFQRPSVLAALAAAGIGARALRATRLPPALQELAAGALALTPALLALRDGELAAYHGAEHVSIGTYEHGEPAAKEHERCGSHLVGPLLVATAAGATLAARAPTHLRQPANVAAAFGAVAAATEIFGWMVRHPGHPVARALSRPGQELQERVATAEPTAEQLEVADAALAACLELEREEHAG